MQTSRPISSPSSYVTAIAAGYANADGELVVVDETAPLPVTSVRVAAPAPLEGSTAQSLVAGPFAPVADMPVHLELSGEWTGRVQLQRSADGGATRTPVTAGGMPWALFEANANEVVWQEAESGATLFLDIQLTSGAVTYRVSQ